MGLEEIVVRINADAEAQAAKMASDAREDAARVIDASKRRADEILSQSRAQAEREVREEKLRSVASARLAAKREVLQAREDVLRRYESEIQGSVEEFVKSDGYQKFLLRAIEDGVSKIGGDAVVQVNSKDRGLLKGKKVDGALSKDPIECKGGAMVSSADGKRRVDNTIESILRGKADVIRLKLVEQLFSGDGTES